MEMEYLREKIEKSLKDIAENDSTENQKINLEYLDMTVINMCDCFGLITHEEAEELRKPIIAQVERVK